MKAIGMMLVLLISSYSLFGQSVKIGSEAQKNYDLHLVMKGETLYSISKKFNTSVSELLKLNPEIVNNNLTEGKKIRVPLSKSSLQESSSVESKPESPVLHEVAKGETVFSISRKYKTDVQTILMWNNLSAPTIKSGQKIIVGYETPDLKVIGPLAKDEEVNSAQGKNAAKDENSNQGNKSENNSPESVNGNYALKFHSEKGIASWTSTTYDDGNFYALHPDAPKGTEITVKNLMNNRTIKVKVIGKLPATAENENVMIRLSESAAKQLNALDEKFLVEISYSAEELVSVSGTN